MTGNTTILNNNTMRLVNAPSALRASRHGVD